MKLRVFDKMKSTTQLSKIESPTIEEALEEISPIVAEQNKAYYTANKENKMYKVTVKVLPCLKFRNKGDFIRLTNVTDVLLRSDYLVVNQINDESALIMDYEYESFVVEKEEDQDV